MKTSNFAALALSLLMLGGVATSAHATPTTAPAAQVAAQTVAPETQAVEAPADDATRYAEREQQAGEQKDFRGGDYVVIGISTGAAIIILIVVLLLVL
jgi:hypothetical protein